MISLLRLLWPRVYMEYSVLAAKPSFYYMKKMVKDKSYGTQVDYFNLSIDFNAKQMSLQTQLKS